jgi:hypothetical protein
MSIQQWLPTKWSDIIGNYRMVKVAKSIVRMRLSCGDGGLPDEALVSLLCCGDSRSGKTATIKLLIRCLFCDDLDPITLNPCGHCEGCKKTLLAYQDVGLDGLDNRIKRRFEYIPVDCTRIKSIAELEAGLFLDIAERTVPRIYFVDELHLLSERGIESVLLKGIEERKAIWILATAKPEKVDEMLRNRLIQLETEAPSKGELANWIVDRANECSLNLSQDEIFEFTQRFREGPGLVLHELQLKQIMSFG